MIVIFLYKNIIYFYNIFSINFLYSDLIYFFSYNNIFKIYFFTKVTCFYRNLIEFECLQNIIYLYPNETSLVFFRLESNTNVICNCLTIYIVYPIKFNLFLTKVQCFCFSNILLDKQELVELPILFFINKLFLLSNYKIYIFYLLLVL